MHNQKQNKGGWLAASIYSHFSLWVRSLRTILMLIFILLTAYMLARSTEASMAAKEYQVHLGETLFCYANRGFNILVTSVALMVMMSELPKRVAYQNYIIMRLSRVKWLISQIVFLVVIVFAFVVLMLVFSALFSLSFVSPGSGWSDLERLAADSNYAHLPQIVDQYIRGWHPVAACALASLILYLFWLTLVFLLLLFSLYGVPNFGLVFCVSMPMLGILILYESVGIKVPSHFSTLAAIQLQVMEHKFQYIGKVIVGYVAIDVLLVVLMVIRVKQMDVRFIEKE